MQAILPYTREIELRLDEPSRVLHLTLNRPAVRNAMTAQMVKEIATVFDSLDDLDVRVIVLRGAGGNFCAGGDVKDMAALMDQMRHESSPKAVIEFSAAAGNLFSKIDNASQAVVGVFEGTVFGGGMGLACAVDIAIASETAVFSLPETRLGLVPAQIAPYVRRRIGDGYARMMAVSGAQFDADWALRAGLVHYLAEGTKKAGDQQLEGVLKQVLADLRACAPRAVEAAKALTSEPFSVHNTDTKHLGEIFARSLLGDEGHEGTTAFREKRKPKWNA